jgi:hypothetical protein
MAAERLSMRKVREVLHLKHAASDGPSRVLTQPAFLTPDDARWVRYRFDVSWVMRCLIR